MGLEKISDKVNKIKNKGAAVLGLVGILTLGVPAVAEAQQFLGNQMRFFTCNFMTPFGYEGIKNVFGPNERISLVDYDPFIRAGNTESVFVYAPDGNLVYEGSRHITINGENWGTNISSAQFLAERGGYGNYRAVFTDSNQVLNNQFMGEADFTILPPQQEMVPIPAPVPMPQPHFAPRPRFSPGNHYLPRYDHSGRDYHNHGNFHSRPPKKSPRGRCLIFDRSGNCLSYSH